MMFTLEKSGIMWPHLWVVLPALPPRVRLSPADWMMLSKSRAESSLRYRDYSSVPGVKWSYCHERTPQLTNSRQLGLHSCHNSVSHIPATDQTCKRGFTMLYNIWHLEKVPTKTRSVLIDSYSVKAQRYKDKSLVAHCLHVCYGPYHPPPSLV